MHFLSLLIQEFTKIIQLISIGDVQNSVFKQEGMTLLTFELDFLEEPKRVSKALSDPAWVEATSGEVVSSSRARKAFASSNSRKSLSPNGKKHLPRIRGTRGSGSNSTTTKSAGNWNFPTNTRTSLAIPIGVVIERKIPACSTVMPIANESIGYGSFVNESELGLKKDLTVGYGSGQLKMNLVESCDQDFRDKDGTGSGILLEPKRRYKNHVCVICYKKFGSAQALGSHKRVHNKAEDKISGVNSSDVEFKLTWVIGYIARSNGTHLLW
ncbi:zinc finger C2H2-type/integrase DNA-binding domain-containing protein [Tanacetum coccineum]